MKIRNLAIVAVIGIIAGIASVIVYNEKIQPQPPLAVNYNPYDNGIYATGIIESDQVNGSNVNIYPEVAGKIIKIFVKDGDVLKVGDPILQVNDSVQQEIVSKDIATIRYAKANLVNVQQQLDKIKKSYEINALSVSKNALDDAINAVKIGLESVDVATKQFTADKALLDEYLIRSPINGKILRVVPSAGGYVSPQGTYDTYTQGVLPVVQMGVVSPEMHVRCYVDEILTPRLPDPNKLEATLFIRGENNKAIPLSYVSIQPYTIPNIELSDERNERVDVRVLPVIFKFKKPADVNIFPGQLVDIFIKGKK